MALGRMANKEELLREMREEGASHERQECGCYVTYPERADLFRKGLLWLGRSGEVSDKAIKVLNSHEEETNRKWCQATLEEFTDYWRGVCREAA